MKNNKQEKNITVIPQEIIESRVLLIRGKKVILDENLATLYGVKTKELNRAVKRNHERFPEDFMFQLDKNELENLRFHFGTSSYGGRRYLPYAFTENGIAMLSSVLSSRKAIQINIQIMRTFTRIRELVISNKELQAKIELLEKKFDGKIRIVFDAINKILISPREKIPETKRIGFDDRRGK